ncbi:hypothetical protein [Stenotrophomonas indicatrix]|uniref:hypothetical protein n=1 Tax=Stenotrophomonas indicatrix TaxID=2045451 RepID=UPI001CBC1702|nr:hypothetical protein [Stenotrophomonas indicatrix]
MPTRFYPDATAEAEAPSQSAVIVILSRLQAGGAAPAEYEYVFFRNDERVAFAGAHSGPDWCIETDGQREHIYSLDMTHPNYLRNLLTKKSDLGSADSDSLFLRRIAYALLQAAAPETRGKYQKRFLVITTIEALTVAGISATEYQDLISFNGYLVLASLLTPARGG